MDHKSSDTVSLSDWSKCILCQLDSKEQLINPTDAGYKTTAENILKFQEINSLPMDINIEMLDHGNGIESTFKERTAKWHKSCNLKFSASKLQQQIARNKKNKK